MDTTPLRHPPPENSHETVIDLPHRYDEQELPFPIRWLRRYRHWRASEALPDNDPLSRRFRRVLQVEQVEKPRPEDMPTNEPTNGEALTQAQGPVTLAAFEHEVGAPAVEKLIDKVVQGATAERVLGERICRREPDLQVLEQMRADADQRRVRRHGNEPQVMRHMPPWQIATIEVLLTVVDASVLYLYFARDFDSNESLLGPKQIMAVAISVFPPLAGVILARYAGRALGCWHHAVDQRRQAALPALVGLALTGAYGASAWLLLDWRFSKTPGHANLPGPIFATIFVVAIMALLAIHAFLESPSAYEDAQRKKDAAALTASLEADFAEYDRTCADTEQALVRLAGARVTILTFRDRLQGKVESLLLQGRALDPHAPRSAPQPPETEGDGSWRLDLGAPPLVGRLLQRIQEVLDLYGSDGESLREEARQMRERLQDLQNRYSRTAGPSPQDPGHDGARVIPLRGDRDGDDEGAS